MNTFFNGTGVQYIATQKSNKRNEKNSGVANRVSCKLSFVCIKSCIMRLEEIRSSNVYISAVLKILDTTSIQNVDWVLKDAIKLKPRNRARNKQEKSDRARKQWQGPNRAIIDFRLYFEPVEPEQSQVRARNL